MREEYVDSDGRLCVGSDSSDESDGEEYHDASDSDQWTEWWCGVASDSTTEREASDMAVINSYQPKKVGATGVGAARKRARSSGSSTGN